MHSNPDFKKSIARLGEAIIFSRSRNNSPLILPAIKEKIKKSISILSFIISKEVSNEIKKQELLDKCHQILINPVVDKDFPSLYPPLSSAMEQFFKEPVGYPFMPLITILPTLKDGQYYTDMMLLYLDLLFSDNPFETVEAFSKSLNDLVVQYQTKKHSGTIDARMEYLIPDLITLINQLQLGLSNMQSNSTENQSQDETVDTKSEESKKETLKQDKEMETGKSMIDKLRSASWKEQVAQGKLGNGGQGV